MSNPIADFMRNAVDLDKTALRLGILPRHYTMKDIELFFTKAADEIDRLERAVENRTA
jgi:hypothetical protein